MFLISVSIIWSFLYSFRIFSHGLGSVCLILNFRIFADENLKMNKSIIDISGEVLIVSQFTLAGKFLKGNRPSFVNAKDPKIAEDMITSIVNEFSKYLTIKTGSFGAMMDVGLVNDGPATFVLTARNGKLVDQAD